MSANSHTLSFFFAGIETFHKTLDEGSAGDQMGVLLKGLKKDDVRRGMYAAKPGTKKQHNQLEVQLYMMTKEEGGGDQPLVPGKQIIAYSNTWDVSVFTELEKGKAMLMPGESGRLIFRLGKPMGVTEGQQLTIRTGGQTIASGKVS